MSLTKIEFADKIVEVFKISQSGEDWMAANPFAEAMNYSNVNRAIRVHVAENNQKTLEKLQSDHCGLITSSLHPQTKFINRAGVFELINASEMPAAKKFKQWNTNDLWRTLCQEGEYRMTTNAPTKIVEGMNAVHVATKDGVEAPWMKDLAHLTTAIAEKDRKINELTVALTQSNEKLSEANNNLVDANKGLLQAFNIINEARKDCETARKETAQLANRMADIAQDVVAKPNDPQLLHSLAVCSIGGDQYAFLRPQKRSLKRSLDRLSVDERDIVFKSDYVPNAVNILNKVKENLPKDKYTARHNKITLLENLTKEDLVKAIDSSMTQRQMAIIAKKASANAKQCIDAR
ncbi:Bro-b [Euproctis pseudoconspersa nucleopolyhedrovirus]|uniref:Bro-b n=1 Tax=Euproctis pseudoconspersa nucleopolyhedrovirus TaxID=307467 RepID=C3TX45_9ABAC|nr:Bro-b [Euproctis pseudoconspersa nucleopolyhedrovirus]ACO53587.1 Bro-b [Euproctis pseudoconspersa nucleopolyhedrovirus]